MPAPLTPYSANRLMAIGLVWINLPKVALNIPKGIKIGEPTEEIRMVWEITLGMKHPV